MKLVIQKIIPGFAYAAIFAILLYSVAFAVTLTINTNDGTIDSNWSSVTLFQDDPDDDSTYPTAAEIDKVWITNNASVDTFYFRTDSLIQLSNLKLMVAKLDCDRNGNYNDATDVAVVYDPFTSSSFECQGDTYNLSCLHDSPEDDNGASSGEVIDAGGGIYTYEWSGTTSGSVDWSGCLGTISVQFAQVHYNNYNLEDDTTIARDYNAPTVIQLNHLDASSNNRSIEIPLLVTLSAALFGSIWLTRFTKTR